MRFLWALIVFSTVGCAATSQPLNLTLLGYAESSEQGYGFESYLIGEALDSAIQTQALMDELGFVSRGRAEFSDLELIGDSSAAACLDVSGIVILDTTGLPANLPKTEPRMSVSIRYQGPQEKPLISSLEVGGAGC